MATKKFTDIIIPKSWFKKTCSEPVAGSSSFLCWFKTLLNNLPVFPDDASALAAGATLYINSTTGSVTIPGFSPSASD
jgi:hypothetical protein